MQTSELVNLEYESSWQVVKQQPGLVLTLKYYEYQAISQDEVILNTEYVKYTVLTP